MISTISIDWEKPVDLSKVCLNLFSLAVLFFTPCGVAFSEMGLNPLTLVVIISFGLFFLVSFAMTSPNMDTKGLLRVLHAKPIRKPDGTVEYREEK